MSPRKRALQTLQCLFDRDRSHSGISINDDRVTVTEKLAEWDYGDYEGLLVDEIRQKRKAEGLDTERAWKIWRGGCEGGEYAK